MKIIKKNPMTQDNMHEDKQTVVSFNISNRKTNKHLFFLIGTKTGYILFHCLPFHLMMVYKSMCLPLSKRC